MVRINPADFEDIEGEGEPTVLSTGDVTRLYVEAGLGIPLSESLVAPSQERDETYAEALEWIAEAEANGEQWSLPSE